jgi:hypothetical protein
MGAALGIPLLANEPRLVAGVVGLIDWDSVADSAAQVSVPVEFLMQWDDEIVPRASALAVYDALGSSEKTLHANPGGHAALPRFEIESAAIFFRRHLQAPTAS